MEKLEERRSKHPNRRMIQKLHTDGSYDGEPVMVDIMRDDGRDGENGFEGILNIDGRLRKGTPVSVDVLNKVIELANRTDSMTALSPLAMVGTNGNGELETLPPVVARERIGLDKPSMIPGFAVSTFVPTSPNTDGIRVCYLESEPATKYDGWLYLIKA